MQLPGGGRIYAECCNYREGKGGSFWVKVQILCPSRVLESPWDGTFGGILERIRCPPDPTDDAQ